jgi:hypothetical protein
MKNTFIHCVKCNKKLIKVLPNGLFQFIFGKKKGRRPPVIMEIHGTIKMCCLNTSCNHINIISHFSTTINNNVENSGIKKPNEEEI